MRVRRSAEPSGRAQEKHYGAGANRGDRLLPRGLTDDPVLAGWFSLNGNGETSGTT